MILVCYHCLEHDIVISAVRDITMGGHPQVGMDNDNQVGFTSSQDIGLIYLSIQNANQTQD